ncbi:hypothetical protein [Streptomyces sp. NRRL F-5727]|uniref:hypothetical protein n=1 Tax=Streptomyces sp. NRRL F-5727 TaxID=1463871 RepID=UPI0004C982C4|nr:hypothetical protein [Streptomyces sp. NRRL F-5727]
MTDAAPGDHEPEGSQPEESQPKPLIKKARDFAKRHKGKIVIVTSIAAAGAVVLWTILEQRAEALANTEEYEDASQDAENIEVKESRDDSASSRPPRNSPVEHDVQGHERTLRDGRIIEIPPHKRGGAKDEKADPGDEDSGEAAA